MSLKVIHTTASMIYHQRYLKGYGWSESASCRPGFVEIRPAGSHGDEVLLLNKEEHAKLLHLLAKPKTCPVVEEGRVCGHSAPFVDTVRADFVCLRHITDLVNSLRKERGKLQAA